MKGYLYTGAILYFAVVVNAYVDYNLKCSKDELAIRWPSYHSNSEYYVCQREGGQQVTMSCNPGEVFTYVLQMCTSPAKFIPPPPMDRLLISQSNQMPANHQEPQSNENNNKPLYLTPLHPLEMPNSPPINPIPLTEGHSKPIWELPGVHIPNIDESKFPEIFPNSFESNEDHVGKPLPVLPAIPSLPSIGKPQVPQPPTPAPTPPVVKPTPPAKTNEKKKPPVPKNAVKKPSSTQLNQKKPPTIPKPAKKKYLKELRV